MFLLVFAFIALFIGSFVIFNTFSIIVAQRLRELALLRAVGASRRQVMTSVLGESLLIGVVASAAGLGAGIGLAVVLKAGLAALGFDLPTTGLVVNPRTVLVSPAAGIVITIVAAISPARRAARIPPVAAMQDVAAEPRRPSVLRAVRGAILVAGGGAALGAGLSGAAGNRVALTGAERWRCSSAWPCSGRSSRGRSAACSVPRSRCAARPGSSASRTRCATPPGRP